MRRRNPKLQVIDDVAPERDAAPARAARGQICDAEVAAEETGQEVHGAGQHEEPRGQEVEASPPAVLIEDVVCPAGADRTDGVLEERRRGLSQPPCL